MAWRGLSCANARNNRATAIPALANTMNGKRQLCDTTISGPTSESTILPAKLPAMYKPIAVARRSGGKHADNNVMPGANKKARKAPFSNWLTTACS